MERKLATQWNNYFSTKIKYQECNSHVFRLVNLICNKVEWEIMTVELVNSFNHQEQYNKIHNSSKDKWLHSLLSSTCNNSQIDPSNSLINWDKMGKISSSNHIYHKIIVSNLDVLNKGKMMHHFKTTMVNVRIPSIINKFNNNWIYLIIINSIPSIMDPWWRVNIYQLWSLVNQILEWTVAKIRHCQKPNFHRWIIKFFLNKHIHIGYKRWAILVHRI